MNDRKDWKFCPRCKQLEPSREKMWCWVCNKCDTIVENKPSALLDIKLKMEDANATEKRIKPQDDQR